jgi:Domain of unknown function (DUF5615)
MLRFLVDENFDMRIVRGLLGQNPELHVVRAQEAGLGGAEDPEVLEWAAREGRVLLTHDVSTVTRFSYDRVRSGKPMPGVFEVATHVAIGRAVDDLLLLALASRPVEWEGQVLYLPL